MHKIFKAEFPGIAKRYKQCEDALGINRLFGSFFSFCVNAARYHHDVFRVHCAPHVDALNLAIGICVIFIYGGPNFFPLFPFLRIIR